MTWIPVSERRPPENLPVIAWNPMLGMVVVTYNFYPAWKPFDEEQFKGVAKEALWGLRQLNDLRRGEPERESWSCACEDSYWRIDEFTHWCKLPPPPVPKSGTPGGDGTR